MNPSSERATRTPSDPPPGRGDGRSDSADALAEVLARIDEIRSHVERLVAVRADRFRIRLRERLAGTAALALAGTALVAAIVGGVFYLLSGLTGGLTVAFGGRAWAGDLAGGAIVLGGAAAVLGALVAWRRRVGFEKMVRRYRRRDAEDARVAAGVRPDEGQGVSR